MKTQTLLGALFLWGGTAFAQTNQQVNYITPNNVQTKLNDYFSAISKTQITSGILMDKSAGVTEPNNYDGSAGCAVASTNDWYTLYKRVDGARTSTSFTVPNEAALFNSIYAQNAEDRIPPRYRANLSRGHVRIYAAFQSFYNKIAINSHTEKSKYPAHGS